jgi:alpha-L-fucosidase
MMERRRFLQMGVAVCYSRAARGAEVAPPQPYGPTPSTRQLRWHEMEFYGFIHFTINTFTDKEWGY